MQKVYFATTNKGRFNQVKRALSEQGIEVVQANFAIAEPAIQDIREIARQKVVAAYKKLKKPCIAQDSGFFIEALGGYPGSLVHRELKKIGIQGILAKVKGKSRKCEFRHVLVYYDGSSPKPIFFESRSEGELATEPRGNIEGLKKRFVTSELWLVFKPKGLNKTLAELTPEEYLKWRTTRDRSHSSKFAKFFLRRQTAQKAPPARKRPPFKARRK